MPVANRTASSGVFLLGLSIKYNIKEPRNNGLDILELKFKVNLNVR